MADAIPTDTVEEEDETAAEAAVETPADEVVEGEAPTEDAPVEDATASTEEAAPVADVALGAAQSRIVELEGQLAMLRQQLAGYELTTALSAAGLPTEAGSLVSQLFGMECPMFGIRDWLLAGIENATSPLYALRLMRAAASPKDPRAVKPTPPVPAAKAPAGNVPSFYK